jgi:predicted metalloprotease with PDZ domain
MTRLAPLALVAVLGAPASPGTAQETWEPPYHRVFPVHRGRIGIEVQALTPELREHLGAPSDRGVLVSRVEKDGAAERAGVKVGDVVTSVDGEPVERPFDLVRRVGSAGEGSTLALGIVREREASTVQVAPAGPAQPWVDPEHWGEWMERGMREGSAELRKRLEELERRLKELEERLREEEAPGKPA